MSAIRLVTPYWEWIRSEAALIDTDGCSGVTGIRVDCCFEHDLSYYYARDPRDAYRHWRAGNYAGCWQYAVAIDRETADARFRRCHQNRNLLGRWSFMALYRWLGVRWKAQDAWDRHRAREKAQHA